MTRPALSVLLPADEPATIAPVVECLAAQRSSRRIELVIVTDGDVEAMLAPFRGLPFAAVRAVPVRDVRSISSGRCAGVRAAGADVVVFGETHSYPEQGWVDALVEAHLGDWTVVGPSIESACPGSLLAWVGLLMDYGPWVERRRSEPMHDVPAHNGAYRRDALLALGDEFEQAIASDHVLNERLRLAGATLYLESRARVRHLNVSQPRPFLVERFHAGRSYAASRSIGWPARRRAAYAVAWPLIPAIRTLRIARELRRIGRLRSLGPRIAPLLLLGLVVSAAGEAFGFASGRGGSTAALSEIELHRTRYAAPPSLPLPEPLG